MLLICEIEAAQEMALCLQLRLRPQAREGWNNDASSFSPEDGILSVNLHNRLVTLVCPEEQRESYNPEEEAGPPSERLRLEWVHGYRQG